MNRFIKNIVNRHAAGAGSVHPRLRGRFEREAGGSMGLRGVSDPAPAEGEPGSYPERHAAHHAAPGPELSVNALRDIPESNGENGRGRKEEEDRREQGSFFAGRSVLRPLPFEAGPEEDTRMFSTGSKMQEPVPFPVDDKGGHEHRGRTDGIAGGEDPQSGWRRIGEEERMAGPVADGRRKLIPEPGENEPSKTGFARREPVDNGRRPTVLPGKLSEPGKHFFPVESAERRSPGEWPGQPGKGSGGPVIKVTIGRIEVHGTPPSETPPAPRKSPGKAGMSLADYLKQRNVTK